MTIGGVQKTMGGCSMGSKNDHFGGSKKRVLKKSILGSS